MWQVREVMIVPSMHVGRCVFRLKMMDSYQK